jgi:hypothetical protein
VSGGGTAILQETTLVQGLGQALEVQRGTLHADWLIIQGFLAGARLNDSSTVMTNCFFGEFPADQDQGTGVFGGGGAQADIGFVDGDNDGLYIVGGFTHISRSVISGAKDDGIDSGTGSGGVLVLQQCWIERCFHEGIALSNNGEGAKLVLVQQSVITGCQQGVELGFSTARMLVRLDRLLLMDNMVGCRYSDNYGWLTEGLVWCTDTAFMGNQQDVMNLHSRTFSAVGGPGGLIFDRCLFGFGAWHLLPPPPEVADALSVRGKGKQSWLLHQVLVHSNTYEDVKDVPTDAPTDAPGGGVDGAAAQVLGWDWRILPPTGGPGATCGENSPALLVGVEASSSAIARVEEEVGHEMVQRILRHTADRPPPIDRHEEANGAGRQPAVRGAVAEELLLKLHARLRVDAAHGVQISTEEGTETLELHAGVQPVWDVFSFCACRMRCSRQSRMELLRLVGQQQRPLAATAATTDRSKVVNTVMSTSADGGSSIAYNTTTGPAAEVHSLVVWSVVPEAIFRAMVAYLKGRDDLIVQGVFAVGDGAGAGDGRGGHGDREQTKGSSKGGLLDEEWYRAFYGKTYYDIFMPPPEGGDSVKVPMTEHKGVNGMRVLLLQDLWPIYEKRDGKGSVNRRMYELKRQLRQWTPGRFHVHASQTAAEAHADLSFLFGSPEGPRPLVQWLNAVDATGKHTVESKAVVDAVLVRPWGRVAVAVITADAVIAAILQSEFYKYKLDVKELQEEMHRAVVTPDLNNPMENIARAALLGSARLALILHLPFTVQWYFAEEVGVTAAGGVGDFRILKENAWMDEIESCARVADTWVAMRKQITLQHRAQQQGQRRPLGNHTSKVLGMVKSADALPRMLVVLATNPDGPYTIWDGNHRGIALFGAATDRVGHRGVRSAVRVVLGVSPRFAVAYQGSFFCNS